MEYLRKCLFFLSLLFAPVPQFIALLWSVFRLGSIQC